MQVDPKSASDMYRSKGWKLCINHNTSGNVWPQPNIYMHMLLLQQLYVTKISISSGPKKILEEAVEEMLIALIVSVKH